MIDPISWIFGGGTVQQPEQTHNQEPEQTYYQEPEQQPTDFLSWLFGGGSTQQPEQTHYQEPEQTYYQETAASQDLNIQGDPDFVQQVTRAYNYLDADDQAFVRDNTTRIEQHHRVSGAFPVHKVIFLGGEVLTRNDKSIAGVLRHEAGHMKKGGAANSQQEELECIADQIRALEKIGGCEEEIAALRREDGNHYLNT